MQPLPVPKLKLFCSLAVEVGPVRQVGQGRHGQRRIIPVIGGRVEGPHLTGTILQLGSDWQTVGEDGTAEMNARYAFETDDGAVIELVNYGFRHGPPEVMQQLAAGEPVPPEAYYMRSWATLETGDPRYAFVNRMMFVCTGARTASGVRIDLYAVE